MVSGIGENFFLVEFCMVVLGKYRFNPRNANEGFCYIKDASDQLKNIILYSGQWMVIINIGSGVPRQLREVVLALQKKIGKGQLNLENTLSKWWSNGFFFMYEKYESYFGQLHLTEFNHSLDLLIDELSISKWVIMNQCPRILFCLVVVVLSGIVLRFFICKSLLEILIFQILEVIHVTIIRLQKYYRGNGPRTSFIFSYWFFIQMFLRLLMCILQDHILLWLFYKVYI